MERIRTFASGLIVGAGVMYLLDPTRGSRRRARIQQRASRGLDQARHIAEETGHMVEKAGRIVEKTGRMTNRIKDKVTGRFTEQLENPAVEWARDNWKPAARILGGLAGLAAVAYGISRIVTHGDDLEASELSTPEYMLWNE